MNSMWRKLTSFLFDEEEIIVEEELGTPKKVKEEEVVIRPVQVLQEKREPISLEPIDLTDDKPVLEEIQETIEFKTPKKSFRIDLEDEIKTVEKSIEPTIVKEKTTYHRRGLLSPMHGGSNTEIPYEKPKPVQVKKHKPLTQIISPIYGSLEQENAQQDVLEEDLMRLDLESMIYEEENDEEVQTSLYDFLEGLENEHE